MIERYWFPALLFVMLILSWRNVLAEPVAHTQKDGVTVTLYNEPCKLDIKLQYRATWKDREKSYEGCFGILGGIVVTYWDDKSIGLIPGQAFSPLTGS